MTIVAFILILALLILVHEFGHFIVAKKNGILVEEFGFGFPPRILGIKKGETLYSLNLIPLGGFVKVHGEEYKEEKRSKGRKIIRSRAFIYKKPWQKASVIVAGIIGNFLLGWILISFLFTQGVPTPTNKVIVEQVQKNSPAQIAGIEESDLIKTIKIQNKTYSLKGAEDLIDLSKKHAGKKIELTILRDGKQISIAVTPRKNPPKGQGPLGIVITSFIEKKYPLWQAPFYGLVEAAGITKKIVVELAKIIFQLVTLHKPSADIAGPVGIAQFTGQAIKFGKNAVLELIALLSLNLAVINILPFPALDGGRLVFVLYEWVTKRRVNKTVEKYVNMFGIIVLLTLAVLITVNDIVKLYK